MKKVILYTAVSLDGFIAGKNGDLKWLLEYPNPEKLDYGYSKFVETVDTTLIGNKTYKEILGFDVPFPWPDKQNFVLSTVEQEPREFVSFITQDLGEKIQFLKEQEGKDIWLVGGGRLNGEILRRNLIDEIILHVIPVAIGAGVKLFDGIDRHFAFNLAEQKKYYNGVLELRYTV